MSRVRTSPLPPLTPGYDTWGPGGRWGGSGENDRGDNNFLGDGTNDHQLTEQWADTSVQRAEVSTSLAITKPNHTENNNQSEVSIFFTPLETMLCSNGLGDSQAVQLRRARRAGTAAAGTLGKRLSVSPRSAKR